MPNEKINMFVEVISRIDKESKDKNITAEDFPKKGIALTKILRLIEAVWGKSDMIKVLLITRKYIGHTPGPLDTTIISDLVAEGFIVKNVNKVVSYEK